MRPAALAALLVWAATLPAAEDLGLILRRVSEEAEVFRVMAPRVVARETLRQKARKKRSRFRIRVGAGALKPPAPKYQRREIVSEYGFSTLKEAPEALIEVRQVVSVDGRRVTESGKARETLTLGLLNPDDRAKKRMLKRFEKLGLRGAATDFGQLILLFRRTSLGRYRFRILRRERLRNETALVLAYEQKEGPEGLTIFEGRRAVRARLEGELWVRASDYLPMRITVRTTQPQGDYAAVHEGRVDYVASRFGVLLPAEVAYRRLVEGDLLVENTATYDDYHMFAAETVIQFPAAEPAAPPAGETAPPR